MRLALFDLDGTLIEGDSDHAFGEHVISLGWVDGETYRLRNDDFYRDYQDGVLDIDAYIDFATAAWRDREASELQRASRSFVDRFARPAVRREALDLVDEHRRRGDLLALVTATNDFITRPIAELFGIPHLIATELDRDSSGRVTGRIRGTPSFRAGKVDRVRGWLNSMGHRLEDVERSVFYSDSTNDLPLLEAVTHPVATNPSAGLNRVARERGWPVLRLFESRPHDQEVHPSPAGQA